MNLNSASNFAGTPMLKFRYFLKNDIAVRLGFSAFRSASDSEPTITTVTAPTPTPAPPPGSTSNFSSNTVFGINIGAEKHFKGSDRLSTYVGADLVFGTRSSYTETVTNPSGDYTKDKNNNGSNYLGLALLTGADYYIAKKVYLGVELGLSVVRSTEKDRVQSTQVTAGSVVSTSEKTTATNGSDFDLETKLLGGVRLGYQF